MRMLKNVLPSECQFTALKPNKEFLSADGARNKLRQKFKPNEDEDENMEDVDEDSHLPDAVKEALVQEHAMSALGGMMWYASHH